MTPAPGIRRLLRCPACRGELTGDGPGFACPACRLDYPPAPSGAPDLRLRRPLPAAVPVVLGAEPEGLDRWPALGPFPAATAPAPDLAADLAAALAAAPTAGRRAVRHLSPEMVSHFPLAAPGEAALDLGCGRAAHRPLVERCGFAYAGIDYGNPHAPMLADAHALPFADGAFAFVLSVAVIEHLAHPLRALQEARRMLAPGGRFVGSVAFLEPHHGGSYYHHSHRAVAHGLLAAGFEIEALGRFAGWTAPVSLRKALFLPRWPGLARAFVWPLHAASEALWRARAALGRDRRLYEVSRRNLAGSFVFSARASARETTVTPAP